MLVLSRKLNEKIHLGDNITVTVLRVQGNTIRLGIDAPRDVRILRGELEPMDNHRTTKDQLFKVISTESSTDSDSNVAAADPTAKEDQTDGEADKAPAARRASKIVPAADSKPRPQLDQARSGRPLASFVSSAHKPDVILHQTL